MGAEAEVAVDVGVEGIVVVPEEAPVEAVATPVMVPEMGVDPATKGPGHLTCHQENGGGVACITAGGSLHFSVLNPLPVLGRTYTPPSLISEGQASSRRKKKVQRSTLLTTI